MTNAGKKACREGRPGGEAGFVLPAVLLLAVVVVLFGLFRLGSFRNQVRMRLDREREIQQTLATRSSLRWLETCQRINMVPVDAVTNALPTARGTVDAILEPAPPLFPVRENARHYDVGNWDADGEARTVLENYKSGKGPEWSRVKSNFAEKSRTEVASGERLRYLTFADESSSTNAEECVRWLTIDLPEECVPSALWTEDPYGRRYLLGLKDVCKALWKKEGVAGEFRVTSGGDLIRFGISPMESALFESQATGSEKLSGTGIWLEQEAGDGQGFAYARMLLRARTKTDGEFQIGDPVVAEAHYSPGIQIAGDQICLFKQRYSSTRRNGVGSTEIFGVEQMPKSLLDSFTNACHEAHGLRLTVEVIVKRPRDLGLSEATGQLDYGNGDSETVKDTVETSVSRIAITPAYEFLSILGWKSDVGDVSEVSTVIRFCESKGDSRRFETVTYDTHGTEATRKRQVR